MTKEHDYVTHTEFQTEVKSIRGDIKDLKHDLSRQITIEVRDTFWKIIPLLLGIMITTNGALFFAVKALLDR